MSYRCGCCVSFRFMSMSSPSGVKPWRRRRWRTASLRTVKTLRVNPHQSDCTTTLTVSVSVAVVVRLCVAAVVVVVSDDDVVVRRTKARQTLLSFRLDRSVWTVRCYGFRVV